MTVNQVAYWNMVENQRHNKVSEDQRDFELIVQKQDSITRRARSNAQTVLEALKTGATIASAITKGSSDIYKII